MHTGWGNKTEADYANLDAEGARALGPDAEAIRFLIDERDILGFGTETIGTDCGHPQMPRCDSSSQCPCCHSTTQECQVMET
jgi:kynurenine formamidase